MSIEFDKKRTNSIKITVMGVGGGGGNSVNRMCAMRDDIKSGRAKKSEKYVWYSLWQQHYIY